MAMVRIHSGNGPHEEMDERAIACFDQAQVDTGLADGGQLRQALGNHDGNVPLSAVRRRSTRRLDIPRWPWRVLLSPTVTGDT